MAVLPIVNNIDLYFCQNLHSVKINPEIKFCSTCPSVLLKSGDKGVISFSYSQILKTIFKPSFQRCSMHQIPKDTFIEILNVYL